VTAFPKGWGGFAERTLIGERSLFAVPDEMPDAEAAGFSIAYRTAWIGLVVRGGLKPGETLVVTGATGGTGAAAVQVGAALGARVLAVAGGPKVETCRHDGADATIDHRRDDLTRAVLDLTDGRGADLAFDPVGGDVFQQCLDALAPGGRLLAVGFAAGAWSDASTAQLVRRNLSVVGVLASLADRGESQAVQDGLVALYRQGRIQPRVADVVGFADLPDALERLAGRRVGGRLVLDVAGALGTG
jgi:NADPH2:quinone reductase